MRWRRRRSERTPSAEAVAAQQRAAADLARAHARTPEVTALATTLAEARARNHFGEAITASMSRRRPA